jgi:predicted DCC family thiol-disulfide oxidoreductase YuxK
MIVWGAMISMSINSSVLSDHQVIMFDGVCTLRNRFVAFVICRDLNSTFLFASLQSDVAKSLLANYDLRDVDSIVLLTSNGIYTRSTAALRIAERLNGLRTLAKLLLSVPVILRDPIYGLVARNRYRMFGKDDQCQWVAGYQERFLS